MILRLFLYPNASQSEAINILRMNNIILFDDDSRDHLLPLTYTRPVGELRIGILTIREKWERHPNGNVSYITQEYLADKFPIQITRENLVINSSVLPNEKLVRLIDQLDMNEALLKGDELVAAKLNRAQFDHLIKDEQIEELAGFKLEETPVKKINRLWDMLDFQSSEIALDFALMTEGRQSAPIPETVQVVGKKERVFIEEGANIYPCTLNTENGPVYIGEKATIMEGAKVRGGLGLEANSQLKMGAKIYGPVTAGPYTKLGGEVNHSIVQGYSNKGHDGFLGHAILGEWCNIGADSNNSNLKNNYKEVKIWNYAEGRRINSGRQFLGLIMGDHSKCGINTMFNTGTVVGVAANIFGSDFLPVFIPSYAWGGSDKLRTHRIEEAYQTAKRVMARRNKVPDDMDKRILQEIFHRSSEYRSWKTN